MLETILGIILIVMSVFLIVAVLMQHGKSHNLSGTIAGGAETFFGKSKGNTLDGILSKVTTVVSIIFVVLVVVAYVAQGNISAASGDSSAADTTAATETAVADDADTADTTVATTTAADTTAADAE